MAKASTPTQPTGLEVLTSITEQAIAYRFGDKPAKLSDLARVVSSASRLLRLSNDERVEVENAALLQMAKARQLVG